MFLAFFEKGIIKLIWLANTFWSPIVIIPLPAGFLNSRTNTKSFIALVMLAITFTAISGYIVGVSTISLMCGTVGSTIGLFGMYYWQKFQGIEPKNKPSNIHGVSSIDTFY